MFFFHVLRLPSRQAKLGNPAFKVLQNIGAEILFQFFHEKWWAAQWKS